MWGKVITFGPWINVDKQNKVYAMYDDVPISRCLYICANPNRRKD